MNTTIIPKFIVNLFKNEIQKIHKMLLYEISKDYNINLKELENKYICEININDDKIQIIKKRNYNTNLLEEKRCTAFNAKNERCQRSKDHMIHIVRFIYALYNIVKKQTYLNAKVRLRNGLSYTNNNNLFYPLDKVYIERSVSFLNTYRKNPYHTHLFLHIEPAFFF